MKLVRFGALGAEKPGLVDADGKIRDLSAHVADISGETLGAESLARLRASGFEPGRDVVVLFTGDEETRQDGARLASTEWRSLIDAEYALNSDAGGGGLYPDGRVEGYYLQVAEKTYADFRLKAVNRGGRTRGVLERSQLVEGGTHAGE